MTVKLAIIGLGRLGASMGLALASETNQLERVGHDTDTVTARKAEKMGAVDKIEGNLHSAVAGADIVVLAVPVDAVHEILEEIARDLGPEAVVIGTAPIHEASTRWAQELLPPQVYFVSFAPTLNPAYLLETAAGIEAVHDDLFKNSLIFITAPYGTGEDAIKLAQDLATLLGARSLFSDAVEVDGLLAGGNLLPQLAAAALINATITQSGWTEARKLAGRSYAMSSEPLAHLDDSERLGQSALLNRDNALRVVDNLMLALRQLREAIADEDEDQLHTLLDYAHTQRETWLDERSASNWETAAAVDMPGKGAYMGQLFGLSALRKLRGKGAQDDQEGKGKKKKK